MMRLAEPIRTARSTLWTASNSAASSTRCSDSTGSRDWSRETPLPCRLRPPVRRRERLAQIAVRQSGSIGKLTVSGVRANTVVATPGEPRWWQRPSTATSCPHDASPARGRGPGSLCEAGAAGVPCEGPSPVRGGLGGDGGGRRPSRGLGRAAGREQDPEGEDEEADAGQQQRDPHHDREGRDALGEVRRVERG